MKKFKPENYKKIIENKEKFFPKELTSKENPLYNKIKQQVTNFVLMYGIDEFLDDDTINDMKEFGLSANKNVAKLRKILKENNNKEGNMVITEYVETTLIGENKKKEKNFIGVIDLKKLSKKMNKKCNELVEDGYKILSIMPIMSAKETYGNYTEGILIVAEKEDK